MIVRLVGLLVAGLAAYCILGSLHVVAIAWVNALVSNRSWFHGDRGKRWTDNQTQTDMVPPLLIFLAWPLVIPIGLIFVIGAGFMHATEKLGDKVVSLGEARRKKIGSFSG